MALSIVMVLAGCLSLLSTAEALTYGEISAFELKARLDTPSDKGYMVVDIRPAANYAAGHIRTAINIPLKELGVSFNKLDRTKDIIVYCDLGIQSKLACEVLINAGFKDVYNLTGGLKEWNYALVTSDGRTDI